MNLSGDYMKRVEDTARAYDKATDIQERARLGARLDELTDGLSEGQTRQVISRLLRL